MAFQNPPDDEIAGLLRDAKTIAVVGASSNPDRTSHAIMQRLQQWGYRTIPVNPNEKEILDEKAYPDLLSIPEKIDIVDVFRRPEFTPEIARQAVKAGAKTLWLQQGIANDEAASIARAGGITTVMDLCIAVAHSMLKIPAK